MLPRFVSDFSNFPLSDLQLLRVWSIVSLYFSALLSFSSRWYIAALRSHCKIMFCLVKSSVWLDFFFLGETISFPPSLYLAAGSQSGGCIALVCRSCAKSGEEQKGKKQASNPITQDAVFQCLRDTPLSKSSSLSVKSIPSVWRICAPVGIVVQTHAAVYDALGSQKSFLPLSYLLNQSPPRVLLFPVCLCSKTLISHIQFSHGFVASTMKCPESFSTSFGNCSYYYWPLSDKSAAGVQQKFFLSHLLFIVTFSCEFYNFICHKWARRLYALVDFFFVQGVRPSSSFYQLLLNRRGI